MNSVKTYFIIFVLFFTSIIYSQKTTWKIDNSHSKIGFEVSHLVFSTVDGRFTKFDGNITTEGDDFTTAKIDITIDVNSINTDNEKRDQHLKSDDFFNAEKFPNIKFVGKSMKKVSDNKYKLIGDFTMRDVTKQIELDVTFNGIIKDSWGNQRAGFKLKGTINRMDYGLSWNKLLETGGAVVGKDVDLLITVQLIKSK